MMMKKLLALSSALGAGVSAFVPSQHAVLRNHRYCLLPSSSSSSSLSTLPTRLFAGKGFGSPPPSPKESDRTIENPQRRQQQQQQQNGIAASTTTNSNDNENDQNMGQKALQELRRQRAEQRDAELRKVREVRSVDEYLEQSPTAAAIPEKVALRMGSRMLPLVGLPLFGSMGAFVAFWYLATYRDMEFQPSMVAFTTIGLLGLGLVGITYAVMSASWDPDREGSALGLDEFQHNVDALRGGLSRSRDNYMTREKMAKMSEEELKAAMVDLERREGSKSSNTRSGGGGASSPIDEIKDLQQDNDQWK